jgi:anti-sigma regulatory factor (Ser/Thr protein kinase)
LNQTRALHLAAEALELRQAGDLSEADGRYRAALAEADPRDFRTPDIHAGYASLLTRLNRSEEAGRQYERALQLELKNDSDEAAPAVVAARYLLGEHYLRLGEPDSARRVIAPSLAAAQKPLAWIVEAEALFLAGNPDEARLAGDRALGLSATDEQRERIRERLSELWSSARPGDEKLLLQVAATSEGVQELLSAVQDFAERHPPLAAVQADLGVVLDEVVSNIVHYGYAAGASGPVTVALVLENSVLRLEIVDEGAAFDPLARPAPDTGQALEDRPIGGLGIHLVRQLMDEARYRREGDKNVLILTKRL